METESNRCFPKKRKTLNEEQKIDKKSENDTIPYFDLRENTPRFVKNDIEFECFEYFLGYIHSTFCQDPYFYIDRSDQLHGNGLCLKTKQDISYKDLKEKLIGRLEHLNENNFNKYYQFPAIFQDMDDVLLKQGSLIFNKLMFCEYPNENELSLAYILTNKYKVLINFYVLIM